MFGPKTQPDSLSTAFTQLLQRFNKDRDPSDVAKAIASHQTETEDALWALISTIDKQVQLKEVGTLGTWPNSNDAIVKFKYQDIDQPYIEVDGERQANILDYYCLVANFQEHTILDPADGQVKNPGYYGLPVGWASYQLVDGLVIEPESRPKRRLFGRRHRNNYILGEGETIWDVAARFNIPSEELIEHNDLHDPANLPAGYSLHLPYLPKKPVQAEPVRYGLLESPKHMHIVKPGGTKKFSFSGAISRKDIKTSGPTFPENTNVEIVAVAHVPLGDDTAEFYMDKLALGKYAETGRPDYTVGFNPADLKDGKAETPGLSPSKQHQLRMIINRHKDHPSPDMASWPTTAIDYRDQQGDINAFKTTYKAFPDGPITYVAIQTQWVHDFAGKRPDRPITSGQAVNIAGLFEKDGIVYGRPAGSAKNLLWFGIPMDNLEQEAELYNTDIPLVDRVTLPNARLSWGERGVVALSKTLSQYTRLKVYLSRNLKHKERRNKNANTTTSS